MRRYLFTPFAAAILLSARALSAHAQYGAVGIRVDPLDETGREYDEGKATRKLLSSPQVKEIVQKRRRQITLTNRTSQSFSNLTVKCFLFARGLDDKAEVQLLKAGKRDVSLGPAASQVIKSDEATTSYTPEHTDQVKKGGLTRLERIPASGQKNGGYGVQVFNGQTLRAEMFVPPDLKSKIAEAPVSQRQNQKLNAGGQKK